MMMKKSSTLQATRTAALASLAPAFSFFLLLAALAVPAQAQVRSSAPAQAATPPRTVTWYADNPKARASVQLACLDDPGRLGNSPDCINAHQANVEVAAREARARTGTMDPRDPAFWSNDPQNRRNKLLMCRQTPQLNYCDVARRSLLIDAGQLKR
jgi:hypothetical protein